MAPKVKTAQEVLARLEKQGKTIKQAAEEIGLPYQTVHAVLTGLSKARRGKAHEAAVALGIKEVA